MKYLILFVFFSCSLFGELFLRDSLKTARRGDFLVTAQGKNLTLLLIKDNQGEIISLDEITAPSSLSPESWKEWVLQGAPGNTSWSTFKVNLSTGQLYHYYSFTRQSYYEIPEAENFLSTLLNLKFTSIPDSQRKRVGQYCSDRSFDNRRFWQPRMVFEGHEIEGISFDAWKTKWPKDSTDLSGRTIEIYLPEEGSPYPAYFPYWLQVSGLLGKAKVRVIDGGQGLFLP